MPLNLRTFSISYPQTNQPAPVNGGALCLAKGSIPAGEYSQTEEVSVVSERAQNDLSDPEAIALCLERGVTASLETNGQWTAANVPEADPPHGTGGGSSSSSQGSSSTGGPSSITTGGMSSSTGGGTNTKNQLYAVQFKTGWPMTSAVVTDARYVGSYVPSCGSESSTQAAIATFLASAMASQQSNAETGIGFAAKNSAISNQASWSEEILEFLVQSFSLVDRSYRLAFPAPRVIQPSEIDGDELIYRGIDPRIPVRLGRNGGRLSANQIAVHATLVDWKRIYTISKFELPSPPSIMSPGIPVSSPLGNGRCAKNDGPLLKWRFEGYPELATVVSQTGGDTTPWVLSSTNPDNPTIIGLDRTFPVDVSVNAPRRTLWANPGRIDLAVKVIA